MKFALKIIIVISFVCSLSCTKKGHTISYPFCVVLDGDSIKGHINLPSNFVAKDKLTIIAPLEYDIDSLIPTISQHLNYSGMANVYLEDFFSSYEENLHNIMSAEKKVKVISEVLATLKKDDRLKKATFGLIGSGISSTIFASESKDIQFLVLLSPMVISGVDYTFEQREILIDQLIASEIEPQFFTEAAISKNNYLDMYKRKLEIIDTIQDVSNIRRLWEKMPYTADRYWDSVRMDLEFAYEGDEVNLLPEKMDFIRHKPKQYYSKIKCPSLVMFGTFSKADYNKSKTAIEQIFNESGKINYDIIVFDSLNCSFIKKEKREQFYIIKYTKKLKKEFSKEALQTIVDWIEKI